MSPFTTAGAATLAVTAISMMLFVMNAHNSPFVRWSAFINAAAAVGALALSYRSLRRAYEKLLPPGTGPG